LGAFDETDDSASGDKNETINEDLYVYSIIIREFLVDSGLDDLGFILLSDGEAAHVGVLDKVPAFVSVHFLGKKLVELLNVVSSCRLLLVTVRQLADVRHDHLLNIVLIQSY
jgi:hypothetical protein